MQALIVAGFTGLALFVMVVGYRLSDPPGRPETHTSEEEPVLPFDPFYQALYDRIIETAEREWQERQ